MNLQYPLDPQFHLYKDLEIIKCKQHKVIIIGSDSNQEEYGALVFNKIKNCDQNTFLSELFIQVEPKKTYEDIKAQIQKQTGPFIPKQTIKAFGIVGFHKFLHGYYMTYITEVDTIAKIGKHKVYTIKNTAILPLFQYQSDRKTRKNQEKYYEILESFKLQNFYFSNTYDLSNSLAINMIRNSKKIFELRETQQMRERSMSEDRNKRQADVYYSQIFAFNYELIHEFHKSLKNTKFVLPLIHGYCKHINVNLKSSIFNIIVIARRSRHHAGTRYNKRGINPDGFVANFVEVQQIVINYSSSQDSRPVCSSFIQVRGSVPTYWMQRPSIAIPKPAIQIKSDDYMFLATRKHFSDLMTRYGHLIYAINLMKMKQKIPRQSLLSKEYQTSMSFINKEDLKQQNQIHYIQIDMKYNLRLDKKLFVNKMKTIAYFAIQNTGVFMCMNPSTSSHQQFIEFQNGVIRANCVDCLDRTNSFQQLMGQTALAIQLNRLIKQNVSFQSLELPDRILDEYSKLYEEMGDLISIQYGSSLAHKQKIQKSTQSRFEFLIAITRHVNNNWNDYDRQRQMDVFLGYKPDAQGPQIWKEQPIIQHYPSRDLQSYETQNWAEKALKKFMKNHYIHEFERISNKEDYKKRNLSQIEKFMKQDLINKFNVDIVNCLVNEKEVNQLLQYFVTPKANYMRTFWPKDSKKVNKFETLKEEMQFCYNRMNFLKGVDEVKPVTNSKKQLRTELTIESPNVSPSKKVKPSTSFHLDQKTITSLGVLKNAQKFIQGDMCFDQAQTKLIQRYMLGQLIQDNQIQDELQIYEAFIQSDIQMDWPSQQQIQKQLKLLATNMANKNYINYSQIVDSSEMMRKKKKTFVEMTSIKTFKNFQERNQKIRENKILILERIMKKNFSHGNIQKIQEI